MARACRLATGRPAMQLRLGAGRFFLQNARWFSDKSVAYRGENPCRGPVSGEADFRRRPPVAPSFPKGGRNRIGAWRSLWHWSGQARDGAETMLSRMISAGKGSRGPGGAAPLRARARQAVCLGAGRGGEPAAALCPARPPSGPVGGTNPVHGRFSTRKVQQKRRRYAGRVMRELQHHFGNMPEGRLRDRKMRSRRLRRAPKVHARRGTTGDCRSTDKAPLRCGAASAAARRPSSAAFSWSAGGAFRASPLEAARSFPRRSRWTAQGGGLLRRGSSIGPGIGCMKMDGGLARSAPCPAATATASERIAPAAHRFGLRSSP